MLPAHWMTGPTGAVDADSLGQRGSLVMGNTGWRQDALRPGHSLPAQGS